MSTITHTSVSTNTNAMHITHPQTAATEPLDAHSHGLLSLTAFGEATDPSGDSSSRHLGLSIPTLSGVTTEARDLGAPTILVADKRALIVQGEGVSLVRVIQSEVIPKGADGNSIYDASYLAYELLFKTIAKHKLGHFVRIWNYIPRYLDDTSPSITELDRERYRQFNAGRLDAWKQYGPCDKAGQPIRPAATGMGTTGGPLVLEALVSHYPVTHVSNPRQTDPYNYPSAFGTKAPAFARATILHTPAGAELYISGTASIVGDRTEHAGDVEEQFHEIIRNLEALLGAANTHLDGTAFTLDDLYGVRIYIKHEADYHRVKVIADRLLPQTTVYLRADICRADLLVEVEAIAKAN